MKRLILCLALGKQSPNQRSDGEVSRQRRKSGLGQKGCGDGERFLYHKLDASKNSLVGHWGNVEMHGVATKHSGYYACERQLAFTVACRLESREGVSTWLVLTGALL